MPAVCVTGMHRSGTSMVISLLHHLGLNVGPKLDLMDALPSNPEGHWENEHFLDFDNALLTTLGGAWDCPPSAESTDTAVETLAPFTERALALRDSMGAVEPWGWKDPRISLLLPFWFGVFPDLKVVVCLRSPLEVAESLRRRGSSSYEFGLSLWRTYNERILASAPREQRLITHYAAYFARPAVEIQRLCAFAGLPAEEDRVAAAAQRIKPMHRHNVAEMPQLIASGIAPEITQLYEDLCNEAEWPAAVRDGIQHPAAPLTTKVPPAHLAQLPVARGSADALLLELASARRMLADLQRRQRL